MYKKLKNVMEEKGISVYKASKETGIHSQDLYACMNGKKVMFNGWKQRIADYLEVPVSELFEEGE